MAAKVASFNWPLVNSGTEREFSVDVRWFATGTFGTKASIVVTIFGVTHVFEAPQARLDQAGPFDPWCFGGKIPAMAKVFTATVLVTGERVRDQSDDHALLTVESLDIMLA